MAPGSIHFFVYELQKLLMYYLYKTSCRSVMLLAFFYRYGERLRAAKLLASGHVASPQQSRGKGELSIRSKGTAFLSHCISQEPPTAFLLTSERTGLNNLIITSRGRIPQGKLSQPHIGPKRSPFFTTAILIPAVHSSCLLCNGSGFCWILS